MATNDEPLPINPDEHSVLRRKIRRLVHARRIDEHEGEDVEQDLLTHLWQHLPRCDLSRGSRRAFICTLIDNFLCNYLRFQNAEMRRPRFLESLDRPIKDIDGRRVSLGETVSQSELDTRRGVHPTPQEAAQWALDLAGIAAPLPERLRQLLERLLEMPVESAAKSFGVHRSTLYRWLDELQERLQNFDFDQS